MSDDEIARFDFRDIVRCAPIELGSTWVVECECGEHVSSKSGGSKEDAYRVWFDHENDVRNPLSQVVHRVKQSYQQSWR